VKSIRFGEFEVDLSAWTLKRNKIRVALQRKPFQILRLLISRAGELVSREELMRELWPDLHVHFDHSLNTAINTLRNTLGDSDRGSRLIETCPGLGYRFAGEITLVTDGEPAKRGGVEDDIRLGHYFFHRFSWEGLARARAHFTAASRKAQVRAAGQVGLAQIEILHAVCGWAPTRETAKRALLHASAARDADPALPDAQIAVAVASGLDEGTYNDAIHACSSALEKSPGSPVTRIWLAELLAASGRAAEGAMHLQGAAEVEPFSLLIRSRLALVLWLAGDFDAAVTQAWSALSLDPACSGAQYALALSYEQLGNLDDAVTEFENAAASSNSDPACLAGLCHALYVANRYADALAPADQLSNLQNSRYVSECWRALVQFSSWRATEAASDAISKAVEEGDFLVGWARHDPRFQSITSTRSSFAGP
jgi:DNA-binding winged helix-turn-helix (wHTH) protein/Flp pilus assembly protein TadD